MIVLKLVSCMEHACVADCSCEAWIASGASKLHKRPDANELVQFIDQPAKIACTFYILIMCQ